MKDDLLKIIKHYGLLQQLKHFQTEIFELNEAIIQYHYDENKYYEIVEETLKKHITEEMADVYVMLLQFQEWFELSGEEIAKVMQFKIHRQLERIENDR